ncbi:hypothetical protein AVEN_203681-1 [Araneus ventricosus]|uniref:Uncharacterized protein n=1 Tax=Araneus ventricosus TaxID=182803 RepID=A0A4Y2EYM7_ARAVE|nr:hypothetical protein AVEN_203681-1 [Araneus ventricosus]
MHHGECLNLLFASSELTDTRYVSDHPRHIGDSDRDYVPFYQIGTLFYCIGGVRFNEVFLEVGSQPEVHLVSDVASSFYSSSFHKRKNIHENSG